MEGDVMPPHFFREGLKLTSDGYVEFLNTVVKPWIIRVANGRPYVCQQDSAPCHTSGKSQNWLSENFYDFTSPNVWPPNSPDLNPTDYFVWAQLKKIPIALPMTLPYGASLHCFKDIYPFLTLLVLKDSTDSATQLNGPLSSSPEAADSSSYNSSMCDYPQSFKAEDGVQAPKHVLQALRH
ncbi:hypothetical protein AAG570_012999 [Ranatra chinensis]|uniref:Transposase n=1 Tax=Ranatra chinensis TaxID=642074 RepID=A0ABD0YFT6_9HEMI